MIQTAQQSVYNTGIADDIASTVREIALFCSFLAIWDTMVYDTRYDINDKTKKI